MADEAKQPKKAAAKQAGTARKSAAPAQKKRAAGTGTPAPKESASTKETAAKEPSAKELKAKESAVARTTEAPPPAPMMEEDAADPSLENDEALEAADAGEGVVPEELIGPEPEGLPAVPPPKKDMTRRELTEQYQPYVRSIAGKIKKTLSKDIEFDDLVSYGMLGLFEAADRYDAKFGANFMTFAYYRIRGAIYDGLRGMGWVSRTEYQRYRFEMHANSYLNNVNDRETVGAEKKSVDDEVGELADVVSGLVTIYVTALDAMEGFQIKDERGPSIEESLETMQARQLVAEAVAKLPEQERKLLQLYYYKELSLEDVGKHLGLSKSWTSRLHTRAIEKLSRLLRDLVTEYSEATGSPPKAGGAAAPPTKSTQQNVPPNR